jgi:hypothetical protein
MTEYFREPENLIQADFAYRIGKIALQYNECTKDFDQMLVYESTLNICLLQNLLTSCLELIDAMSKDQRTNHYFSTTFDDNSCFWELSRSMVRKDTFIRERVTYKNVIEHLRNALSHPTPSDPNTEEYPSTGFTTPGPTGSDIKSFIFIDSPNVRNKRPFPKNYDRESDARQRLIQLGSPPDFYVEPVEINGETKYQIWTDGKSHLQIFWIEIPVKTLTDLVLQLSNFLAQPVQQKWDGKTITKIIE